MKPTFTPFQDPKVESVYFQYPETVRVKLFTLREMIFLVAAEIEVTLEETLKWGEPSYLTKHGSTVRLAWRQSSSDQYGLFFNCKTSLIETFKEVYGDVFSYEGNRAIIFKLEDEQPINELKHCITLSLNYKKIKNKPLLGR